MPYGFSLNTLPVWTAASFMRFKKDDRPVTRTCKQDVLILVFDGVFLATINGDEIELNAGDYYLAPNGSREAGNISCDCPYYYYFHFKPNVYNSSNILPNRGRFDTKELLPMLEELDRLVHSRGSKVAKAALVYGVLTALKKQNLTSERKVSQAVERALKSDLKKQYTVKELARLCGYSANYFIQAFKKETGKTPHAYIAEMRISAAKELILSGIPLEEVASECGFPRYTNFYRAFKSSVGVSPRLWKQEH